MRVLLNLWKIKDGEVVSPYLILSHGYGLTKNNKLPVSTKRVLRKTIELMNKFPGAWCIIFDSNYFKVPKEYEGKSEEYECQLKREYLMKKFGRKKASRKNLSIDFNRITFATKYGLSICNTVQEIDFTNNFYDLNNMEVASVCDHLHARRVRYIWKKLTLELKMNTDYKVVSEEGVWKRSLPSFWQKSNFRWLVANMIGCLFCFLFGVERMSQVTHKMQ